jgi:rubrerythrin
MANKDEAPARDLRVSPRLATMRDSDPRTASPYTPPLRVGNANITLPACAVCGTSREMMAPHEPCATCGTQLEDAP